MNYEVSAKDCSHRKIAKFERQSENCYGKCVIIDATTNREDFDSKMSEVKPHEPSQTEFEGNMFYNQTQLAKLSGMSIASVSRYLKRHKRPYKLTDTGRSKMYDNKVLRELQQYREQQLTADNVVHESASSKALATQNRDLQTINKKLTQELAAKDKLIEKLTHDNDLLTQVIQANTKALETNNEINKQRLELAQNAEKRLSAPKEDNKEEPKKKGLFGFWKK